MPAHLFSLSPAGNAPQNRADAWHRAETAEAALLHLRADRRALLADNAALAAQVEALSRTLRQAEAQADHQRRRAEGLIALVACLAGQA